MAVLVSRDMLCSFNPEAELEIGSASELVDSMFVGNDE